MEGNLGDWFTWFRSNYLPIPFLLMRRQGLKDQGKYWEESFWGEMSDVRVETM